MNYRFIIVIFLVSWLHQQAQLITNSNVTPNNLVQNTLLGGGVNAYNVSYTGSSDAIGFFNGANCNIGLGSGIIMTTGTVRNQSSLFGAQQGPFGPNDEAGAGTDNNQPGDSQLENYANGNSTTNAAILEFDFDAVGSAVSFNYVFASDEYPEFVNAGYNDVFAFWISGPGIVGNKNIAVLPGTNTAVTIDNVNANLNNFYYINNGNGNSSPQNNNSTVVQYDGFTKVLTATTNVQCGGTYHIKIAICDVGDGQYDSGVFLEAQSFSSPEPMIVSSQVSSLGALGSSQLLEGCSNASITYTRAEDISSTQTFNLSYSGTAINGTDYSALPNSITFPAGQTNATLALESLLDNINEGSENLTITLTYSGLCGQQTTLVTSLEIIDQIPLQVQMPNNQELSCLTGSSFNISPLVTGGTPNYNYSWNTGDQTPNITATPTDTTIYTVSVSDACGTQTQTGSIQLTIKAFSELTVTASNDTTLYCPNSPLDIFAISTGGAGNISYQWDNNAGESATASVQTLIDKTYTITASDECGNSAKDSLQVTIIKNVLSTSTYGDTIICPFGEAVVGVNANNGTGNYRYEWDNGTTTNEITALLENSSYLYVNVYDSCNTYFVRDSVFIQTQKPIADFIVSPLEGIEKLPLYFSNQSQRALNYIWEFGNNEFSDETNPNYTYYEESDYIVTLIAIDNLGCRDTVAKNFKVHPEYFGYVPNAFTPNGDGVNDFFRGSFLGIKELECTIFDRWGKVIYQSSTPRANWNGTENNKICPVGTYIYQFKVKDYSNVTHEYQGHVTLIR